MEILESAQNWSVFIFLGSPSTINAIIHKGFDGIYAYIGGMFGAGYLLKTPLKATSMFMELEEEQAVPTHKRPVMLYLSQVSIMPSV